MRAVVDAVKLSMRAVVDAVKLSRVDVASVTDT